MRGVSVRKRSNLSIFLVTFKFIMKKSIHFIIIILLTIAAIISKNVPAFSATGILSTDHCIINYSAESSSYAITLAAKLESSYSVVTSFLEINPMSKINVFISPKNASENFLKSDNNMNLYIPTESNPDMIESELYNQIFHFYLKKTVSNSLGLSAIDENFIDNIVMFPVKKRRYIDLILNDLVNVLQITSIDFKKIGVYSKSEQSELYTALIDFIISNYGKKILVQSLKDSNYYNGFSEALSGITGDSLSLINSNFNKYLLNKKNDSPIASGNKNLLFSEDDEFSSISFSISENGQAAELKKSKNSFILTFPNRTGSAGIILKNSETGSSFNDLVFIDNNQLAVVEIIDSGSIIHIYDIKSSKFINKVTIPLLFISDLNPLTEGSLIFSATSGLRSNIYSINIADGVLDILTDTGNDYSPVMSGNKIYYISRKTINRIIEFNRITGENKILFSTEQDISNLNCGKANNGLLVFNVGTDGLNNIYTYNLQSSSLQQFIKDVNSNLKPQISGRYIYYYSLYKSQIRIFYGEINNFRQQ